MAYRIALNSPTRPFSESKNVDSCPGMPAIAHGMALEIRSSITPGSYGEMLIPEIRERGWYIQYTGSEC